MTHGIHCSAIQSLLTDQLRAAGVDHPSLEARWIVEEYPDLTDAQAHAITARRAAGEPLSRIFGWREFYGRRFDLTPATLDPRPETEGIVDRVLAYARAHPVRSILDLGTGSGCLAVTLSCEIPASTVQATDCSAGALAAAQANAQRHGAVITWVQSDWWTQIQGRFDVIVSNPPYIPHAVIGNLDASVRCYDPPLALDGGADGLGAYRALLAGLRDHLNTDGVAFFEIGFDQADSVAQLTQTHGLRARAVHADLSGHPRIIEISND